MNTITKSKQNLLEFTMKKLYKGGGKKMRNEIPIWQKYTLSIEEAAEYFRIGQRRLRQMVADDPNADFILMNGNRVQIKRKLFEEYINDATVV